MRRGRPWRPGARARARRPGPGSGGPGGAAPAEWRAFEGSWSASGKRPPSAVESGAAAAVVELSGAVVLTSGEGLSRGFRGEAIGFDDGQGVSVGRAVWTDEHGDRIFGRLKGEPLETGRRIVGTITGGTGRYAGLAGEYSFTWQYVVAAEDGAIQGRAVASRGACAGRGDAVSAPAARKALLAGRRVALALGLWFSPVPEGLVPDAWHLFALFVAAIVSVVIGAFPILTASVLALAAAVLTGTLPPAKAYSGFANGTILLIVVAFLVARAVVKCGLGERLGHLVVSVFGRSTLGLGLQHLPGRRRDRAGVPEQHRALRRPLPARALGGRGGGRAARATRAGAASARFLMFSGMASLTVSSALWFTAMAANPLGAEIARGYGVEIGFGSWLVASSVPTLVGDGPAAAPPLQGHRARGDGDAGGAARRRGGRSRRSARCARTRRSSPPPSWAWWRCGASAATLGLDSTAVAFLGLGVLLATGVLTLGDIAKEGDVLATFIWFAVLFTMSGQLNELGFMGYLGQRLAGALGGLSAGGGRRRPRRRLRAAALPVRQPDRAPAGALRRLPRRRREARRAGGAARVPAAVRDATSSRRSRRRARARTCCSRGAATSRRASCTSSAP